MILSDVSSVWYLYAATAKNHSASQNHGGIFTARIRGNIREHTERKEGEVYYVAYDML